MKSGLVIYVANLEIMSAFYREAFALTYRDGDHEYVALARNQFELVLLRTDIAISYGNAGSDKAHHRADTAIKPVFFVDEPIADIRTKAAKLGGSLKPEENEWDFDGARVCDGWDPEGNIFQVRSRRSA